MYHKALIFSPAWYWHKKKKWTYRGPRNSLVLLEPNDIQQKLPKHTLDCHRKVSYCGGNSCFLYISICISIVLETSLSWARTYCVRRVTKEHHVTRILLPQPAGAELSDMYLTPIKRHVSVNSTRKAMSTWRTS